MKWTIVSFIAAVLAVPLYASEPNQPSDSYGSAVVTRIRHIDDNCTLFCDIEGFPPIIGQNMPVMLKDLKPAASTEANRKIKAFLNLLLLDESDSAHEIRLANIQRGQAFCLSADIRCNGKDVNDLLIQNGLAYRVIQVKMPEPAIVPTEIVPSKPIVPLKPSPVSPPAQTGYIASKTSKVFHRPDCAHVKKMNTTKALNFKDRQEALNAGRRPCKVCRP